jgi:sn-glycerol 3-phosphate transport system substrate-binding protein
MSIEGSRFFFHTSKKCLIHQNDCGVFMIRVLLIFCFFLVSTVGFAKKLEITFWHSMGFHTKNIIEEIVGEYNRTHTGVTVTPVFQGSFDEMQVKLLAVAVTRQLPDVAKVEIEFMRSFIDNSLIEPLDKEIPREMKDDVPEVMWDLVTSEGKIYGVPFCISTDVFFYNEDAFRKVGLDPDIPPATWEEMVQMGKKLTRDIDGDGVSDTYGVMFWMYGLYGLAPVFGANGGNLFSDDGKRVLLTSKEMITTVSMIRDLVFTHKITPQKWTDWESGQAFLIGKLAMGWFSSSGITYGEQNFPWTLRVAPIPLINNRHCSSLGGSALVNFSKGRAKRRAVDDFMFWLINKENTIRFHKEIGFIPVRVSALNSIELKAFHKENPNYQVPIDALEYARPLPKHPEFYKINKELREMLQRIILQEADPYDELMKTERKINEIIQQ